MTKLQEVVEELQAAVFKAEAWHLDPHLVKESQGTLTLIRAQYRSMNMEDESHKK
jgi:hypothetical protein